MRGKLLFATLVAGLLLVEGARPADGDAAPAEERVLKQAGLGTDDAALLDFFRKRTPKEAEVRDLVKKLGDDDFQVREKASRGLVALGPVAEPYLREALSSCDPEVARRAEECLKNIRAGPSAAVVTAAARLLARRKPAGAAEVLLAYAPRAEGESTAEAVEAALAALAVRDGKPDPVLVKVLDDKDPARRAAAAVALARGGARDQLAAVRQRLRDPEAAVRLKVGLALASLREKDAVPVLIDLLAVLDHGALGPVEDLLYRLAEDKAPDAVPGNDAESRRKYRDAWARWWKDEGGALDMARLDAAGRFLGYTMIVLLDAGRILEVDAANKPRWQIDGLGFPLDTQYLPGERVLVAEYKAGRVTERNRKGDVLWEKRVDDPLAAQRLANGHTFIATPFQLLEVDGSGKQVFSYVRPQGDRIMKAQKQRNGDIGLVTDAGLFVRLDSSGRELNRFPVNLRTSGGRIDLLPDGRVLVPLKDENQVVEYDARGKRVWSVPFADPVNAVRLPNGHTLITSYQSQRAVEVDRDGKAVWEYKADARLTRAWRR
jgi:hypothetical protein